MWFTSKHIDIIANKIPHQEQRVDVFTQTSSHETLKATRGCNKSKFTEGRTIVTVEEDMLSVSS